MNVIRNTIKGHLPSIDLFKLSISPPDINECDEGDHNCDMNSQCNNKVGSFECHCDAGYAGNGTHCDGK